MQNLKEKIVIQNEKEIVVCVYLSKHPFHDSNVERSVRELFPEKA